MTRVDGYEAALALHRSQLVIDGHADSILGVAEGKRRLTVRSDEGHLDFPRAIEAGLTCTTQAIFVEQVKSPQSAARAFSLMEMLLSEIEAASPDVILVRTAADLHRAKAERRLAVLIDMEGAAPLHGDLSLLHTFYRLGLRMMQPVWNYQTELASGAGDETSRGGLTALGRQWVREMNRLGMVIDLSHITAPGFYDVLAESTHPVLFTHGCCRSRFEHSRNLTDHQIQALAAKGGVFGVTFANLFMSKNVEAVTYRDVADHIDHAVGLVGPRHVAYGSDFDGAMTPIGLKSVEELPNLTAELMRRGYSESDLGLILGQNYLRVFEQVLGKGVRRG